MEQIVFCHNLFLNKQITFFPPPLPEKEASPSLEDVLMFGIGLREVPPATATASFSEDLTLSCGQCTGASQ